MALIGMSKIDWLNLMYGLEGGISGMEVIRNGGIIINRVWNNGVGVSENWNIVDSPKSRNVNLVGFQSIAWSTTVFSDEIEGIIEVTTVFKCIYIILR